MVTLTQLPMKRVIMDIVVANIPAKYGMLLSRSWAEKLGGTLQMDMKYATVPVFDGEKKRLYRENKLKYVVNNARKSKNHPVYVVEDTMDCFQLAVSADFQEENKSNEITVSSPPLPNHIWQLFFEGASMKEGDGTKVVLIPPQGEMITISHKL